MPDYTPEQREEFNRRYNEITRKAIEVCKMLRSPSLQHPVFKRRALMKFYAEDVGRYIDSVPEDIRNQQNLAKILKELDLI
jgi:hypothetical protein